MIKMKNLFNNKYQDDIMGTNSCFDRVILKGSIIPISYLKGLGQFLSVNNILLKEFLPYAKDLAETIKKMQNQLLKKKVSNITI